MKYACLGAMVLGLLLLDGCKAPESATDAASADLASLDPVKAEQLRVVLYGFADNFAASVAGTADEIARTTTDPRVREMTVMWKLRVIPTVQDAVLREDPRVAFVDVWGMCIQMTQYLENENWNVFGDQNPKAVATSKRLEQELMNAGSKFTSKETLAKARKEIEAVAAGNPIKGRFAAAMIKASESAPPSGHMRDILSIPIAGLSQGATAIDRIAAVTGVFTEVLQDLPERTRWQTELLLLQTESLSAVTRALKDFEEVAASFKSIAATTESLPADVRKELETLIASTDKEQANLRKTLKEGVDLTEQFTRAGVAWEATAKSVDVVLTKIKEMEDGGDATDGAADPSTKSPQPADDGPPFDINDYTRTAEAITAGAAELRGLIDDLESKKLESTLAAVDKTAESSIDHATAQAQILVDQITYRTLLLIGGFFVGLVLYRLLSGRLAKRSA